MVCGVLSGNRNFEGRINPHTRANYLASPLLCIAYAIAGTVSIDFETEPLGEGAGGMRRGGERVWRRGGEWERVGWIGREGRCGQGRKERGETV